MGPDGSAPTEDPQFRLVERDEARIDELVAAADAFLNWIDNGAPVEEISAEFEAAKVTMIAAERAAKAAEAAKAAARAEFTAMLGAEFPDAMKTGWKHGDDSTVILARPARRTVVMRPSGRPRSPRHSPSTTAGATLRSPARKSPCRSTPRSPTRSRACASPFRRRCRHERGSEHAHTRRGRDPLFERLPGRELRARQRVPDFPHGRLPRVQHQRRRAPQRSATGRAASPRARSSGQARLGTRPTPSCRQSRSTPSLGVHDEHPEHRRRGPDPRRVRAPRDRHRRDRTHRPVRVLRRHDTPDRIRVVSVLDG